MSWYQVSLSLLLLLHTAGYVPPPSLLLLHTAGYVPPLSLLLLHTAGYVPPSLYYYSTQQGMYPPSLLLLHTAGYVPPLSLLLLLNSYLFQAAEIESLCSSLTKDLQARVDPFDLDVFTPYMQRHCSRQRSRSAVSSLRHVYSPLILMQIIFPV